MDGPAFTKRDSTFILCDKQGRLRSRYPVEGGVASGRLNAVGDTRRANDLPAKPDEESPTFKQVWQARRHELWRVAHPYDRDVAVRIIDLRPVYRRREDRIRAHVTLCWLASSWPELRRELARIHIGTFTGLAGTFRQRTELTKPQWDILRALEIDAPPRIYQLKLPVEA
jgi:hypothetical protein